MNTIKFTITPSLFNSLFIVSLICLFNFNSIGQNKLEWFVEGSLHSSVQSYGTSYSMTPASINNSFYVEGTHPVVWGYVIHQQDTLDFEILVKKRRIYGSGPFQISIYNTDNQLDIQSTYQSSGLEQEFELQFNIFEYQSRLNANFEPGLNGIPATLEIGLSRPNENPTGVGVLHTIEIYYVDDLNSSAAPVYNTIDLCNQLDVSQSDNPSDPIQYIGEPIDAAWMQLQESLNLYPYNSTERTYMHVMQRQNTCDDNMDGKLALSEARYRAFFSPMSSFVIGRRDVKKDVNGNTGFKSSIGLVAKDQFLPIELNNFTAALKNSEVLLNWETLTESNNAYFQIERSSNGINWEVIDKVAGAGNSTQLLSYHTIDYSPLIGDNYYRLKQVDFDGQFSHSPTVVVNYTQTSTTDAIQIYPNPTNSNLHVKGLSAGTTIQLFNSSGMEILNQTMDDSNLIDMNHLSPGIYLLYCSEQKISRKIIKS